MSTGKRLAKRSIIGTRVVAPREDGLFHSAVIHAVKSTREEDGGEAKYSVRFDDTRAIAVLRETELIGPGFQSVHSAVLKPGQRVYLTYNGREVTGDVREHDTDVDEVDVIICPPGHEESVKLNQWTWHSYASSALGANEDLVLCLKKERVNKKQLRNCLKKRVAVLEFGSEKPARNRYRPASYVTPTLDSQFCRNIFSVKLANLRYQLATAVLFKWPLRNDLKLTCRGLNASTKTLLATGRTAASRGVSACVIAHARAQGLPTHSSSTVESAENPLRHISGLCL
ncbi:c-clamp [Homalodisca vitripennis]|nr:c-clamp [Homalodisca vitripennis]